MAEEVDSLGLRRSTRRLIIQSREEYAATMTHDPSDTPGLSSGHQFGAGVTHDPSDTPGPSRPRYKRALNSGSPGEGGRGRRRMKRVKRELEDGEEERSVGRRGVSDKGSQSATAFRRRRQLPSKGARRRLSEQILPVRRSKREKRLIFSNFNQQEINRQLLNPNAFPVIEEFSEEEMDPYEKLLSPHRRTLPKKKATPTSFPMSLRSSSQFSLSDEPRSEQPLEKEGETESSQDGQGEVDEGNEEGAGSEEDEEEEDESENSEEEEGDEGERGYFLRKRRPVIYQYQPVIQVVEDEAPPKRRGKATRQRSSFFNKAARSVAPRAYQLRRKTRTISASATRRRIAHRDSTTTTSGSDSDEARFQRRKSRSMKRARMQCLPMNFAPDDATQGVIRDRTRIGASLADVDPMNIDRAVTFDSVGGLGHHIRALKEMIIFPLLYPEVFQRFKIQPPRGVLFYGPPGCGKTLVARALANECSKGGKKVAFFMRKGADCLSKWVGESERQLRLLFDQAYQMRPSIIFFDEIDGLAPVRSTRQDQIHSSIVSTLLALMDGLDARGEIVVIGATNRIDTIDPALRRPGRFDREFLFPLPSRESRLSILGIHTREWEPPLKPDFLAELADNTVGYCGADLKALCTEATLHALRRNYPQIYQTSEKLVLDVSRISISAADFLSALKAIVPTAQRSDASVACALSERVRPLLITQFQSLLSLAGFVFPHAWRAVGRAQKDLAVVLACETERLERTDNLVAGFCEGVPGSLLGSSPGNDDEGSAAVVRNQFSELYRSSQPAQLAEVYFDLSETVCWDDDDGRGEGSRSILANREPVENRASNAEPQTPPTSHSPAANPSRHPTSSLVPHSFLSLTAHPHATPTTYRPRLVICGEEGMGQSTHLAPALLHALEDIPVKILDLPALYAMSSKTPEEACTQVFREARRVAPSVIFIPRIGSWWGVTTESLQATFLAALSSLPSSAPLLVLATAERKWVELPHPLQDVFTGVSDEPFTVHRPSLAQRRAFFSGVLLEKPLVPPPPKPRPSSEVCHAPLPVAPPPEPRELTQNELEKLEHQREAVLRELRVFLRDATNKLLAERKFKEFTNPVNPEEVPDYYDIIVEPMDLGKIMKKIDEHHYTTPKQWLRDVDLVTKNALEYNPEHDSESRLLRHRAVALQDMAHSFLDHELSEDFEKQCEDIEETQQRLAGNPAPVSPLRATSTTAAASITSQTGFASQSSNPALSGSTEAALLDVAKRRSLRQKGLNPDAPGLPYYSPPKPRTPRKHSRGNGDDSAIQNGFPDCGTSSGMELGRDDSRSSDTGIETAVRSAEHVQSSDVIQNQDTSRHLHEMETETSGTDVMESGPHEGVLQSEKAVSGSSSRDSQRRPLRNSLVRRQLLSDDKPDAAASTSTTSESHKQPTAANGVSESRPQCRSSRRSTSSQPLDGVSQEQAAPKVSCESELQLVRPKSTTSLDAEQMNTSPSFSKGTSIQEPSEGEKLNTISISAEKVNRPVIIDRRRLLAVFEQVTQATGSYSVEEMEKLHSTFEHLVFRHRMKLDRSQLVEDLETAMELII